jgi:hypothetical protein
MPAELESPPLRVIYRCCGGDSTKPRPAYYSKLLALASLLRAAEALDKPPQLVFLNDQVRPGPVLSLMEASGEVVPVNGGSNSRTYRLMLAREAERPGRADQFLWFAEDDYLYQPDALHRLMQGVAALPDADYLTVYGSWALGQEVRGVERVPIAVHVDGIDWYRVVATTSTFGTRLRTLREDLGLLRFCALTGGSWDTTTCKTFGGIRPFTTAQLLADLFPGPSVPLAKWPRAMARGAMRLVATGLSYRPHERRRKLYAADPELIQHMEVWDETTRHPITARTAAVDWDSIAKDTVEWARERGIAMPPLVAR